jgi:Zn-dependent M28 family amino/carboxypeptidase
MNNLGSRLRATVECLCKSERNTGRCPEGLHAAADFLESAFRGLGLTAAKQEFQAGGVACSNVEAVAPSYAGHDSPHIVIGAHYDSAEGTVGADDNASAVAVLVEVARLLKDDPSISRIRFVAYANEEPPHFTQATMGSRVHAKACRARHDKIAGMICLESLGVFTDEPKTQSLELLGFFDIPEELARLCRLCGIDPTVGNFLVVVGNEPSRDFLRSFDSAFKRDGKLPALSTDFMGDFLRLSDHLAYWDEGFPAIMLTDTAMCRNTHYHEPSDTPEKLNYPVMALLAERVAGAIGGIASEL